MGCGQRVAAGVPTGITWSGAWATAQPSARWRAPYMARVRETERERGTS